MVCGRIPPGCWFHHTVTLVTEVMLCVNTIVIGIETDYSRGRKLEELQKNSLSAKLSLKIALLVPLFLHGTCVKSISQTSKIASKHPSSLNKIQNVFVGLIFSFCFVKWILQDRLVFFVIEALFAVTFFSEVIVRPGRWESVEHYVLSSTNV